VWKGHRRVRTSEGVKRGQKMTTERGGTGMTKNSQGVKKLKWGSLGGKEGGSRKGEMTEQICYSTKGVTQVIEQRKQKHKQGTAGRGIH